MDIDETILELDVAPEESFGEVGEPEPYVEPEQFVPYVVPSPLHFVQQFRGEFPEIIGILTYHADDVLVTILQRFHLNLYSSLGGYCIKPPDVTSKIQTVLSKHTKLDVLYVPPSFKHKNQIRSVRVAEIPHLHVNPYRSDGGNETYFHLIRIVNSRLARSK
jgi:hypothetical protein